MSDANNVWDRLTEEQRKELEEEYKELQRWDDEQRKKRKEELIEQGKWRKSGLDANQEFFADIIEERRRRFKELQKKYGYKS